jgi:DnaJ-class molecular chaperone
MYYTQLSDVVDEFTSEIDGNRDKGRGDLEEMADDRIRELEQEIESIREELQNAIDEHFAEECTICDGTGHCNSCDGDGECHEKVLVNGGLEAHLDDCEKCYGRRICGDCEGTGDCAHCEGTGLEYEE